MSAEGALDASVISREELESDFLFDQHIFRTISYSLTGFVAGIGASIFFKYKRPIIFFSGGIGAGQGVFEFQRDLEHYRFLTRNYNELIQESSQL